MGNKPDTIHHSQHVIPREMFSLTDEIRVQTGYSIVVMQTIHNTVKSLWSR